MAFQKAALLTLLLPVAAPAPEEAADTGRGYLAYVTAEAADQVALLAFDPDTNEARVVQRIDVGYHPTEIEGPHGLAVAPDGRHWFVSMAHGTPYGVLYKYTTETNELVGQCQLGLFPATMQISDATGLLYCVNFNLHGKMEPSSVSVVDPDEMVEVARTVTGPMPHGSRISPDGLLHYSCSMMGDRLYELDCATFEVTRELELTVGQPGEEGDPAPRAKPTWVYPHPERPLVYVALNGAAQVVEVDTDEFAITRRFDTDAGPYNIEVSPDGKTMAVTYKTAGSVGIWDLETGTETAKLPSTRRIPHGVVITGDGRYALVTNEGVGGEMGTVDVIDLESLERVATTEVGLQAAGIVLWKFEGGEPSPTDG